MPRGRPSKESTLNKVAKKHVEDVFSRLKRKSACTKQVLETIEARIRTNERVQNVIYFFKG